MLHTTMSKVALCAAGGAVAAMGAAGPALAAPSMPDGGGKVHHGWTTEKTKVHKRPSHRSPVISWIQAHRHIYLKCKVRKYGDTWYKLAMQPGWVNSDTVRVRSHVPHCRWEWGMHDGGSMNDAAMEEASLYPAQQEQAAAEPVG
ncbi:hypothetical protein [Streptomyces sp. TR06-5]|uniref:hypothetical protein n=1 Tax=unclassified Streptomyces TaxID=2593676 RepID=UPI0039A01329